MKWEYIVLSLANRSESNVDWILNHEYGAYGWELVCVNNNIAYLKRPVTKSKKGRN